MAELAADPEYQRAEAERQRLHGARVASTHAALAPILRDLRNAGVDVSEWSDLLERYVPLPRAAVEVLLLWLPRVEDESVKEIIVRDLGAATTMPFDGLPLVEAFETTENESLRWAIANTLSLTQPTGVEDWLVKATTDPASGKAREMLA